MAADFSYFRRPELAPLLLEFFLFSFATAVYLTGLAMFVERQFRWGGAPFGPTEVGYVFAWGGLVTLLLQGGLLGRLIARYGERRLIYAGLLVTISSYAVLGFTADVPVLLIAVGLISVGVAALRPSLTSLISQSVDRGEQGVVLGLSQSLNSLSQVIAPIFSGFLIGRRLLTGWGLLAAAISALALVAVIRSEPSRRPARAL